jgi:hypothetical protein
MKVTEGLPQKENWGQELKVIDIRQLGYLVLIYQIHPLWCLFYRRDHFKGEPTENSTN